MVMKLNVALLPHDLESSRELVEDFGSHLDVVKTAAHHAELEAQKSYLA